MYSVDYYLLSGINQEGQLWTGFALGFLELLNEAKQVPKELSSDMKGVCILHIMDICK